MPVRPGSGPVLLVDGLNLIYRCFHATSPALRTPDGRPANAVYGLVVALNHAATELGAAGVIVAGERGETWRHAAYPAYKGTRKGFPPDMAAQLPDIALALRLLGVPTARADGHEADDVLATLAGDLSARGHEVVILSNDRDLLQVAGERVAVLQPTKASTYRRVDGGSFLAEHGFAAGLLPDYKALAGDTSDNIPGVVGIGPVTARRLVGQHGDLEAIIAAMRRSSSPKSERRLVIDQADDARRWKALATLTRDVALPVVPVRPWLAAADMFMIEERFPAMGLERLVPRLRALWRERAA